jgi:hypothetical protein
MVKSGLLFREQAKAGRDTFGETYVPLRPQEQPDVIRGGGTASLARSRRQPRAGRRKLTIQWRGPAHRRRRPFTAPSGIGLTVVEFVKENPDSANWQLNRTAHAANPRSDESAHLVPVEASTRGRRVGSKRQGSATSEKSRERYARPTVSRGKLAWSTKAPVVTKQARTRTTPDLLAQSEDIAAKVDGKPVRV